MSSLASCLCLPPCPHRRGAGDETHSPGTRAHNTQRALPGWYLGKRSPPHPTQHPRPSGRRLSPAPRPLPWAAAAATRRPGGRQRTGPAMHSTAQTFSMWTALNARRHIPPSFFDSSPAVQIHEVHEPEDTSKRDPTMGVDVQTIRPGDGKTFPKTVECSPLGHPPAATEPSACALVITALRI